MTVIGTIFRVKYRCPFARYNILERFVLLEKWTRKIKGSAIIKRRPIIRPPELVLVYRKNCIFTITRKQRYACFTTFPLKEIPFLTIRKDISIELCRRKCRRRNSEFFVEGFVFFSHEKFFTSYTAFLFFYDVFIEGLKHK